MSTDHFEDTDHDRADGIAAAMHATAFSFEAPASAVLHAGALAHARRHRRRTVAGGTLAAVAVVGVAGAAATWIPTHAGTSPPVSAGTTTSRSGAPAPAPATSAAATPAKHLTIIDQKDFAKSVLDIALGALPAGSHPLDEATGMSGSMIPSQKNLPVTAPTDVLASVDTAWSIGTRFGPTASFSLEIRTEAPSCASLTRLRPQDTCTVTAFAKGGEVILDQSRKDPVHQTGDYVWNYIWLRPDGAEVVISQEASSVSQFAWTEDQVHAVLALPAWDQAVTQLKAFVADADGSTAGG